MEYDIGVRLDLLNEKLDFLILKLVPIEKKEEVKK